MKPYITLFLLALGSYLYAAAPFNGSIQEFEQPNGSKIKVKLYGNAYYMRGESLDGYTLIKDPQTKWICYAQLNEDGTELLSTGIHYLGQKADGRVLQFPQHLDVSSQARGKQVEANKMLIHGADEINRQASEAEKELAKVEGHYLGLCIVVDFSDRQGTLPIENFEDFCNADNYTGFGNNGSVKEYYNDISYGLVEYENVVFGYFRAPKTFAQYDAMGYAQGAKEILKLACEWIDAKGFDFSSLSLNGSRIRAINLMYTGNPAAWAQGMWYHQGSYSGFSADGVTSGAYNTSPANSPLTLSVVVHENGHMICNWPDTYSYDSDPDYMGAWDVMCSYGSSTNPVPPQPIL